MVKLLKCSMLLILALFLVACEPEEVVIPTLVEFPTLTATYTPSITPTLTPKLTATATASVTATATHTSTATATPTSAVTSTATWTPFPTLTSTLTPTLTPTVTVTYLPTITPLGPPVINVFQANKTNALPGETITFRWDVSAQITVIDVLDASGAVIQSIPVEPVGAVTIALPQGVDQSVYRLTATRAGAQATATITIEIGTVCNFAWFFNNATTSIGCPSLPVTTAAFAYQNFVNGWMFRVTYGGIDNVCAIQNDRSLYSCYRYQAYTGTPPSTPPANQFAPGADFASVYYTNLAVGGYWYTNLGWAVNPSVTGTTTQVQSSTDNRAYIQTPLGIYGFDVQFSGQAQPIFRVQP